MFRASNPKQSSGGRRDPRTPRRIDHDLHGRRIAILLTTSHRHGECGDADLGIALDTRDQQVDPDGILPGITPSSDRLNGVAEIYNSCID